MSNKKIDDWLDAIYDPNLIATQKAEAQANYEDRVIRHILTKLGRTGDIPELVARVREITGSTKPKLSATLFNETYAGMFPAQIRALRIPYVHKTTLNDLYSKFFKTRIGKAWLEFKQEVDPRRQCALIFPYPGMKGKHMVCHTDAHDLQNYGVAYFKIAGDNFTCLELLHSYLDRNFGS